MSMDQPKEISASDVAGSSIVNDQNLLSAEDSVEFPYRAISSTAITSLVFAGLGFVGGLFLWPALGLSLIGFMTAWVGYRQIRKYPQEYEGLNIAAAGMCLNALIVIGGSSMHAYVYLTEVPEGYTRVQFYELQQETSQSIDAPTQRAIEIDGESVFLKGYIHPSSGSGMLKRFILVPDLGTCCFGGQPKSCDMIEVTLTDGQSTKAGLTKKKLAGTFLLNTAPRRVTDFDNSVFYRMKVDDVR
ncbi:DUF3299 domain-containing protein [Rhodopirellula sp.]|nr:DUF3299 domain-containing protein [Rhodopirellula sp.]MDB4679265.1 DUF3299 domain-containing protein [Rhodopirellula sp.]